MPIVDLPLNELKMYNGTNPCPKDFDAFWAHALEEMGAVDSNVTLVPSSFISPVADCFDLYFTGVRGARIHAKFARPKTIAGKCPAVLLFHGYSSNAGDWCNLLTYAGSGFCIAALDCRGQGGLSEDVGGIKGNTLHGHIIRGLSDKPENMLMRHIFLDTAQLAGILMAFPEVDENRVGAFGGSQGGGLTIACAALEPRIKKLAPVYPFLCDYKRVWQMDLVVHSYVELKTHFRNFDPFHEHEDELFTQLGYIDVQYLAKRIKGEVLMAVGLMDTSCPPSTQFAMYNKITSPKEVCIYYDYGHEFLPQISDRTYEFFLKL